MGTANREGEEALSVNAKPFQPSSAHKGTPLVVHVACGNENGTCDTPYRSQHVNTPVHQRVVRILFLGWFWFGWPIEMSFVPLEGLPDGYFYHCLFYCCLGT